MEFSIFTGSPALNFFKAQAQEQREKVREEELSAAAKREICR